jgi:hypothetical protein
MGAAAYWGMNMPPWRRIGISTGAAAHWGQRMGPSWGRVNARERSGMAPNWAPDEKREPPEGVPPASGSVPRGGGVRGLRRTRPASRLRVSEAARLPTDRLIERELGRQFSVFRLIGRGLIPVDGVSRGGGERAGEFDGGVVGSPTWRRMRRTGSGSVTAAISGISLRQTGQSSGRMA